MTKNNTTGSKDDKDFDNSRVSKKPKLDGADDDGNLDELIEKAWKHYRNYTDSTTDFDDDDNNGGGDGSGDEDELIELLDLFENHTIEPIPKDLRDITVLRTKKRLLPVLLSVAAYALADKAIEEYLQQFEKVQNTDKEDDIDNIPIDDIQKYLSIAVTMFPQNAAAWSMAANFARITFRLQGNIQQKIIWYQHAAESAARIRTQAIQLLEVENENVDNNKLDDDVKEWIELLLLNQITGVELLLVPNIEKLVEKDAGEETNDEDDEEVSPFGQVASKEVWSPSSIEGTSRFMLAMLSSMAGDHDTALEQLKQFPHLSHRLHPNVWKMAAALVAKENITNDSPDRQLPSEPAVYRKKDDNGILPVDLYNKLSSVFAPDAPYWVESDYNNRGYYSYFMDLPEAIKSNKPQDFTPKNVIEDVVCNHLLRLVKKHLTDAGRPDEADTICGYEWWVHTRPIQANLGHNLHFDTDEALLAQEQKITHPIISSVMYLTGGKLGGPTIVFDQTPESKDNPTKAWLSVPHDNSCLLFSGDLLHGVLPCHGNTPSKSTNAASSKDEELLDVSNLWTTKKKEPGVKETNRLTFMVGFWTRRVPDNMKTRKLYGPCGPLPPLPLSNDTDKVEEEEEDDEDDGEKQIHTWVADIRRGYDDAATKIGPSSSGDFVAKSLPIVENPWEEFREYKGDDVPMVGLNIPRAIDHRYFVSNAPQCFTDSLFEKDDDDDDDDDSDDNEVYIVGESMPDDDDEVVEII